MVTKAFKKTCSKIFYKVIEKLLVTRLWRKVVQLKPRLFSYPNFPMEEYFKIRDILRQNPDEVYCFVGVDNACISTVFQQAVLNVHWAHSGFIYIDEDNEVSIDHVRWFGRLNWKLVKYLKECDEFALLRIPLNSEEKSLVKAKLLRLSKSIIRYKIRDDFSKETQYTDIDYWLKSKRFILYCSEYTYFVCQGLMGEQWKRGLPRFSPDDVYDGCEIVWEYRQH